MRREFFVQTNSNAAPFFSDEWTSFVEAESADEAAGKARQNYKHPAGLFALAVYASSDAFHKGQPALVRWLSPRAEARTNGVPCAHCGGKAHLSMANAGPQGHDDHYDCEACGKTTIKDNTLYGT